MFALLLLAMTGSAIQRCHVILSENRAKLKIAVSFYQIVIHMEEVYHVHYPDAVHEVLHHIPLSLSGISRVLFGWTPVLDSGCLGFLASTSSPGGWSARWSCRSRLRFCWSA